MFYKLSNQYKKASLIIQLNCYAKPSHLSTPISQRYAHRTSVALDSTVNIFNLAPAEQQWAVASQGLVEVFTRKYITGVMETSLVQCLLGFIFYTLFIIVCFLIMGFPLKFENHTLASTSIKGVLFLMKCQPGFVRSLPNSIIVFTEFKITQIM